MPYETDNDSKVEFLNTLSVTEDILVPNASCQVVFGGILMLISLVPHVTVLC